MSKSDNSTGLIHLCYENNLIITNTVFPHMKQLMYTEAEASKNEKSIVNYIIVRKESRKFIKLNSVALVRERTIPTERLPPVGEVSANFCG